MKDAATVEPENHPSLKQRIIAAVGLPLWVFVSFMIAALIIGLAYQALLTTGTIPVGAIDESVANTVIAALVYILTLAIVIYVPEGVKNIRTTKEELGLTRMSSWMDIALAPAAFIAYMLCAGVLTLAVSSLFPGFDAEQVQEVGFENISKYYEYALAFITLVVIAPIAEEVLVRGYLYGKLRKFTSVAIAMIISSLLFSLMHLQWNVAVNVFPLALIMVGLREMTGSIWAGILLHMLKNGVAFYFLFVNPSFLDTIVK